MPSKTERLAAALAQATTAEALTEEPPNFLSRRFSPPPPAAPTGYSRARLEEAVARARARAGSVQRTPAAPTGYSRARLEEAVARAQAESVQQEQSLGAASTAGLTVWGGGKKLVGNLGGLLAMLTPGEGFSRLTGAPVLDQPFKDVEASLRESGERDILAAQAGKPEWARGAIRTAAVVTEWADAAIPVAGWLSKSAKAARIAKVTGRVKEIDGATNALHSKTFYQPKGPGGIRERIVRGKNELIRRQINAFDPVERLVRKHSPAFVGKFLDYVSNARAATDLGKNPITNATRKIETLEETGESFLDITSRFGPAARAAGVTLEQFEKDLEIYMWARRVRDIRRSIGRRTGRGRKSSEKLGGSVRAGRETSTPRSVLRRADDEVKLLREKYGALERFEGVDDSISAGIRASRFGRTAEDVGDIVRATTRADRRYGGVKVLDDLADDINRWTGRAYIDTAVEVGWISPKAASTIRRVSRFYSPLDKTMSLIATQADDALSFGSKGGANPIKGKMIVEGTSGDLQIEPILDALAMKAHSVTRAAHHQMLKNVLWAEAKNDPSGLGVEIFQAGKNPQNAWRAWENGVATVVDGPADVLKALSTVDIRDAGRVIRWAESMSSLFRAAATLTLRFSTRNILRDPTEAAVKSAYGQIPFFSPAKAVLEGPLSRLTGSDAAKFAREWKNYKASQAPYSSLVTTSKMDMAAELKSLTRFMSLSPAKRTVRQLARDPAYGLKFVAKMFETPARFAEFKLARKAGKSVAEAGRAAAETPIDFLRAGADGRMWNAFEPFYNVGLQDPSAFFRAFKARPRGTLIKSLSYFTVPSLANWAKNHDNPDWRNLPEYEKLLFLHPHQVGGKGNGGRFVRMPQAPGIFTLLFSYLPQKALDAVYGEDPEAGKKFIRHLVSETPLKYTPLTLATEEEEGKFDFLLDILPQALQPALELRANRVPFTDRPAVSRRLAGRLPEDRFTETTTSAAQVIGQTGPGKALGGPAAVDFLIQRYTGSLGSEIIRAAQPARKRVLANRGIPKSIRDIPVIRSVVGALTSASPVGFGTAPVHEFYNLLERAELASQSLKHRLGRKQRFEFIRDHPEVRYVKQMRQVRSELSGLAEYRRQVVKGAIGDSLDLATADDRLMKTDASITMITSVFMERVLERIAEDMRRDFEEEEE